MPFKLKNIIDTYENLVNKMFKDYIRKIMEVYVDNMLVNSIQSEDHLGHLRDICRSSKRCQKFFSLLKSGKTSNRPQIISNL